MKFNILITEVNVVEGNQSDLTYFIATLSCDGIKLSTRCYDSFKYSTINNVSDAVGLISLMDSADALDKGDILNIAVSNDDVEYEVNIDTVNKYRNEYGRFIKIN